jgi:hypothetical protein
MNELIKGVRVDGDKVIVQTKGNDAARALCGVLVNALDTLRAGAPVVTELPRIDPEMIPAGCALPAFDGVEEAQMALRRAGAAR